MESGDPVHEADPRSRACSRGALNSYGFPASKWFRPRENLRDVEDDMDVERVKGVTPLEDRGSDGWFWQITLTSPPSRVWRRYFQEAEATADGGGGHRLSIIGNKITFVCRDGSELEKLIGDIDGWILEVGKRMRQESEEADRRKAELTAGVLDREHRKIELHGKYKDL